MENTLKENKMGTERIPRLLFSISVPIIISMLVQALYNIIDSIFVAQYDSTGTATAALTIAFPIQNLMIAVAVGLAVGTNALLSRSLGQKNYDKASVIAGQGFFLTLCGYLLFLVFGLFFVPLFVGVQSDAGTALYNMGVQYTEIISVFSIGVFIQVVCERLLQATGKSILSMVVQLSGAVVNIILDPIMIFGLLGCPRLGVSGAAIATVIGQAVSGILGIILNLKYNKEIRFSLKNLIPKFQILREMLAIGIPSVLMQAISSVMTFSMNLILTSFEEVGEIALGVFGIYFKLQSFVFMPVFGLNNGMVPIVAYNYGAGKRDRIYATMKLSAAAAVSYMILGFAVFQLFPSALLGMFNASEAMLEIGRYALRIISISFIMAGFSIVSISVCQALGKSIYSLIVSICRQLVVLIPSAYLLSLTGEVKNVWWAFPIAELVGCTLCITFLIHVLRTVLHKRGEL
jgi:putative MATE family efflux protein